MTLLKALLRRTSALLLAFVLGIIATALWIYHLPDDELGSNRYDLAKVKEDVLVWWYQPAAFRVFVPPKYPDNFSCILPTPCALFVSVGEDKQLKLNGSDMGTIEDTSRLKRRLRELFQQRLEYRAYRVGLGSRADLTESDRIEKTVYVKADHSVAYGEVLKLVDGLKGVGADPVRLQIDDSLLAA